MAIRISLRWIKFGNLLLSAIRSGWSNGTVDQLLRWTRKRIPRRANIHLVFARGITQTNHTKMVHSLMLFALRVIRCSIVDVFLPFPVFSKAFKQISHALKSRHISQLRLKYQKNMAPKKFKVKKLKVKRSVTQPAKSIIERTICSHPMLKRVQKEVRELKKKSVKKYRK